MTIAIPYSGTERVRKYLPIRVRSAILALLLVRLLKLSHCGKDLFIRGVELLAIFLRGCI